jgi:hypothetical protein
MANEITIINTVSKKERNGIFVYHFPLAIIEANPTTDTMRIIDIDRGQNQLIAFDDISNPFGTSNIVEYCDALAAGGYYFIPVGGGGGGGGDLAAIETNTENTATSTASIDGKTTTVATNTGNTATSTSATAVSAASIDTKATTIATNTGNTAANTLLLTNTVITDGIHDAQRVSIDEDYLTLNAQISTANTNIRLSLKQTHDNLPLFYDRANGGAGAQAYSATLCNTAMTVTSGTDYAIAQTFMRPAYTAATTHCVEFTMSNFQNQANVYKRIGLFNGGIVAPYATYDGVYIESDGVLNKYYACYANAGTVTRTELTNLTPYGVTVDWSKHQVVTIRYLYLGGTAIQFSLMIGSHIFRVAEIQLSNIITNPFILRPNQPVRYEIRSVGGAGTLNQVCAAVYTIGDGSIEGTSRAEIHPGGINYGSAGTEYALMAFRKKVGFLSVEVRVSEMDIAVSAAETFHYRLVRNPTIANAPAYTSVSNSAVEYFIGANNTTIAGGDVLHAGTATEIANTATLFPSNINIGHSIAGVSDVFVISIIPRTGGMTPFASAIWSENQ